MSPPKRRNGRYRCLCTLLLANKSQRISEFYEALVLFVFRVLVGKRFNVAEIDFKLL